MTIKLSSALYNATISGDTKEVERLRNEIDNKYSAPKSKESIINFNTVLNNDRSSAVSIYDFLNKNLGEDWWEWETETIEHVLWLKFAVALEGLNRERIFAIRHLCNSDRAFWDWYEFNQLSLAFSGAMADFEYLKKPSPGMVISAVKTMKHIRPDREDKWGGDVIKYICIVLKEEGIYTPPRSIESIIQDQMKEMVGSDVSKEWQTIARRFNELVQGKNIVIEETMIDIQAKRLLTAEASAVSYGS